MGVGSDSGMKTLKIPGLNLPGRAACQSLPAQTARVGEDLFCELLWVLPFPDDSLTPTPHAHILLLPLSTQQCLATQTCTRFTLCFTCNEGMGTVQGPWSPAPSISGNLCSPGCLPKGLGGPDFPYSPVFPLLPCCGQAMQISEMILGRARFRQSVSRDW